MFYIYYSFVFTILLILSILSHGYGLGNRRRKRAFGFCWRINGGERSSSPLSVIPIISNMMFFRDEYGTYPDIYQLPADAEEFERLSESLMKSMECVFDDRFP